jgi:hypothetical protein
VDISDIYNPQSVDSFNTSGVCYQTDQFPGLVAVADGCALTFLTFQVTHLCGDTNFDRKVNIGDPVVIINYIFLGGAAPVSIDKADVNCDGSINISDAMYLISYIFMHGSPPCDSDADGELDC